MHVFCSKILTLTLLQRPSCSKRRKIMAPPDGFQVSHALPTRKQSRPSIASFTSEFVTDSEPPVVRSKPIPIARPQYRLPPRDDTVSEANTSNERILKPPIFSTTPPRPKPAHKPPLHMRTTPLIAFRPRHAPSSPPPSPPPVRNKLPMTRYLPPPPSPPAHKPILKTLAPPPPPVLQPSRSASPSKEMRTISSIALTPSSTAADLLSISLQAPLPAFATCSELDRGVQISPSKSDRSGKFKFARYGRFRFSFSALIQEIQQRSCGTRIPDHFPLSHCPVPLAIGNRPPAQFISSAHS
jgi:hypothetical protein